MKARFRFFTRIGNDIKRHLITGMLAIIPIFVTILVIKFIVNQIQAIFGPIVKETWGIESSFLTFLASLFLAFGILYLIGFLSAFITVKRIIAVGETILSKIPFVKFFYNTTKQVIDTFSIGQGKAPKKVVIIEYPRKGMYAYAFATGETVTAQTGDRYVNLFLPSTPNPTTGFLLMLKEDEVHETNLTMEEAMRVIISGGILPPTNLKISSYQPRDTMRDSEQDFREG